MGRRSVKTRQELVRIEFGESRDLFRQAAHHAAEGVGASVGPRYAAAKTKASSARGKMGPGAAKVGSVAQQSWSSTVSLLTPLAEAAREGSAKAAALPSEKAGARPRKARNGNGNGETHPPVGLISLLAAGAALGAAGALVARRRNRARWAEYEPSELQSDAASMVSRGDGEQPHGASKLAHWAKENTRSAVGTVRGKLPGSGAKTMDEINERVADTGADVTRDLTGESGPMPGSLPGEASATQPSRTAEGAAGGSMADEVDAALRSPKDGNPPKNGNPPRSGNPPKNDKM